MVLKVLDQFHQPLVEGQVSNVKCHRILPYYDHHKNILYLEHTTIAYREFMPQKRHGQCSIYCILNETITFLVIRPKSLMKL